MVLFLTEVTKISFPPPFHESTLKIFENVTASK